MGSLFRAPGSFWRVADRTGHRKTHGSTPTTSARSYNGVIGHRRRSRILYCGTLRATLYRIRMEGRWPLSAGIRPSVFRSAHFFLAIASILCGPSMVLGSALLGPGSGALLAPGKYYSGYRFARRAILTIGIWPHYATRSILFD